MKLAICSLKDRAINAYNRPFVVRTTAEAVRSLTDEANTKDSEISKHPEDYDLYLIGYFDDQTGDITDENTDLPNLIVRCQDLIRTNQ